MPIVPRYAKWTGGYRNVPYRHIDGQTYNALITSSQALTTPTGVSVTPQGTAGAVTYGYRVSAVGGSGETLAAAEQTTATGNATLTGVNFNRVAWTAVTGAGGYNIYRTTGGATQGKIGFIAAGTNQFDDTGLAAAGAVPTGNTSRSFNIFIPVLKIAGASAANKTNVPTLMSRTATGGIVLGR